MSQPKTARQHAISRSGNWLYWVAGISLANAIIIQAGSDRSFALGLGITTGLNFLAKGGGPVLGTIAFVVTLVICVVLGLLGYFACQGQKWAFLVGIIVLLLDTALLFVDAGGLILSILLHCWAIFSLFQGLRLVNTPEPEVKVAPQREQPNPDPFANNR